jgi:hypothetical protein
MGLESGFSTLALSLRSVNYAGICGKIYGAATLQVKPNSFHRKPKTENRLIHT